MHVRSDKEIICAAAGGLVCDLTRNFCLECSPIADEQDHRNIFNIFNAVRLRKSTKQHVQMHRAMLP